MGALFAVFPKYSFCECIRVCMGVYVLRCLPAPFPPVSNLCFLQSAPVFS